MDATFKLIRNYKIEVIEKEKISKKIIFNIFFFSSNKIIYVLENKKLVGIITVIKFLKCIESGKGDIISYDFKKLIYKEDENIIEAADLIMKEHGILTAIPVVNEENEILFEIARNKQRDEVVLGEEYREKLDKYRQSIFLKKEFQFLPWLLDRQKIVVIGSLEKFNSFFSFLGVEMKNTENIEFISEDRIDPFTFMAENDKLLIDLIGYKYSARESIYRFCRSGFNSIMFLEKIIYNIENESFSVLNNIINENKDILYEFIDKYIVGEVYTYIYDFTTYPIIDFLRSMNKKVVLCQNIYKKSKIQMWVNGRGWETDLPIYTVIITFVEEMVQYKQINKLLNNRNKVYNFSCDGFVRVSKSEADRCFNTDLRDEYIDSLKKGVDVSFFFQNGADDDIVHRLLINPPFLYKRTFENDLNLYNDFSSNSINIENGIRSTVEQPDEYYGNIYFIGPCVVLGAYVRDAYTIPSIIQRKLNLRNLKYRVVNLGNTIGFNAKQMVKRLENNPNDFFVILFPFITPIISNEVEMIELAQDINILSNSSENKRVNCLDIPIHCSEYGSEIFAKAIGNHILDKINISPQAVLKQNNIYNLLKKEYGDLQLLYKFEDYLSELRNIKVKTVSNTKQIGAIVMNCNPFTLGHKYLVETALKEVDYLYLFVVEEDRSFFSFKDRFEMVRRGIDNLENVCLFRSGKCFASSITFSEYFQREQKSFEQVKVSCVMDCRIFAEYIAPELQINVRFVGEEPFDYVTNQYNETLKKVLPMYGITVKEIPRLKTASGEIISASSVRKGIQDDYKSVSSLLPCSTIKYLKNGM